MGAIVRSCVSRWLVILSFVLFLSGAAMAQSTGGRIFGRVSDPSAAVVPGVSVSWLTKIVA